MPGTPTANARLNATLIHSVARLKELTVVVLFAGFGGTGGLLEHTIHFLQTAGEARSSLLKQCVQDVDSVLLEGARLFPPVGGINPYVVSEDRELTLGNGRKHFEHKGGYGSMNTNGGVCYALSS